MDIKVELKGFDQLRDDLERLASKGVPYAVRDTLTGSAFALQKNWREDVRGAFTLRNRFTEQAIRVDKATGTKVESMEAVTGTIAPYMRDQEEGNEVKGRGKHKAIPTAVAAGQGQGAKRTRMVRAGLRLQAVHVLDVSQQKKGRRANAMAIAVAVRKGMSFVLLGRKNGGRAIFDIRESRRGANQHTKGRKAARVRMVWDMSRSSVKVPREPTLQRSIHASQQAFEKVQYSALLNQLQRHKVMGY